MPQVQLNSIIISEDKIEQIKAAISQLQNHETIFNTWGFEEVFEKGTAVSLLFHGIPGTGKTLMAQALADFLCEDLVIIGTGDIETSEPGGAERAIKEFFKLANVRMAIKRNKGQAWIKEKYGVDIYQDPEKTKHPFTGEEVEVPKNKRLNGRPQILLFDECDSLLMDRNNVGVIMSAQINTLLGELERYEGVVVFTTNRIGKLDGAVERRITAKIEFEFPNKEQRTMIWKRMIPQRAPIDPDVNYDELAEFELVGGNIKNVVLNAAREAAYKHLTAINRECFFKALQKEISGLEQFTKGKKQDMMLSKIKKEIGDLQESMDSADGISIQRNVTQTQETEKVEGTKDRKTRIARPKNQFDEHITMPL